MTAEFAKAGAERFTLPGEPLPFFLREGEGEGERAHLFDSLVTVLLSKDETEGQFGVFTLAAPRGEAIPTHTHADVHEIFFVLGGQARVWIQDAEGERLERLLGPGDFGYVPAGLAHTFRVEADDTRILGVCTGGFERFFAAAGTHTDSRALPPAAVRAPSRAAHRGRAGVRQRVPLRPPAGRLR
jgi:quercetin 2,3-dioxygenase